VSRIGLRRAGTRFAAAGAAGVVFSLAVANAAASIETTSGTTTIPAGSTGYARADCPGGTGPVMQGFRVGGFNTAAGGVLPTFSRIANTPEALGTAAFGTNPSSSDGTLTDYAYCDTEPQHISKRFAGATLPSGSNRTMTAACPDGTLVVGGGFVTKFGSDGLVTFRSKKFGNGWRISVYNPSSRESEAASIVYCQDHRPDLRMAAAGATTNADRRFGVATVEPTCPAATQPIAGGFEGPFANPPSPSGVAPLVSRRTADGWRLSGSAMSPTADATLTGYVYCEQL
jgi:hypothetical protein